MKIKEIEVKDYISQSNLPNADYVINPYIGCPHGCKYCYASFMKRFTKHKEDWGKFIDIKHAKNPISTKKLDGKKVFLSSVTDCYNSYEETYQITRSILEKLVNCNCTLYISTKSKLILRDIDILKQMKNVTVSLSINTLDENFRQDMDCASTIKERLETLKELHKNNIKTVLFMSPIFPQITDYKKIIENTKQYIDEYWFENLNLRGDYKLDILNYIDKKYPQYSTLYYQIYEQKEEEYWILLSKEIEEYCNQNKIKYQNYFDHKKLVQQKILS